MITGLWILGGCAAGITAIGIVLKWNMYNAKAKEGLLSVKQGKITFIVVPMSLVTQSMTIPSHYNLLF